MGRRKEHVSPVTLRRGRARKRSVHFGGTIGSANTTRTTEEGAPMIPRVFALLIPAALAGCAAGTSVRAAEGENTDSGPVSLAPAPDDESQPAPANTEPAPQEQPGSEQQPQPETSAATPDQGYAPYGGAAASRTL